MGIIFWQSPLKLCADNLIAWQNAMKGFEASLSVPEGTYVSSWAGYGQGCCGMTAAIWNSMNGTWISPSVIPAAFSKDL